MCVWLTHMNRTRRQTSDPQRVYKSVYTLVLYREIREQKMGGILEEEEGLLKRFRDLEASQEKLREQLRLISGQGTGENFMENDDDDDDNDNDSNRRRENQEEQYDAVIIPGYFAQSPYRSVLDHMGHAVHVCRPRTGEIIYWNQSAENLYGWKDYEASGQRVANLLIDDENHPVFEKIMERVSSGQTWSGQFPFRKKSGQQFMAMVTKSPLYENNELIGVIIVSSDIAIIEDTDKERSEEYWNEGHGQQRERKLKFGRLCPQPGIAASVSNLASKLLPRIHSYVSDEGENSQETCGCILETETMRSGNPRISASKTIFRLHSGLKAIEEKAYKYEETISKFNQQSKIAAKVFSKLNIRGHAPDVHESDNGIQTNQAKISEAASPPPMPLDTCTCTDGNQSRVTKNSSDDSKVPRYAEENMLRSMTNEECCVSDVPSVSKQTVKDELEKNSIKCIQRCEGSSSSEQTEVLSTKKNHSIRPEQNGKNDAENGSGNSIEDSPIQAVLQKEQRLDKQVEDDPSSANSERTVSSSQTCSSAVEKKDLNLDIECDIHWEDLHIGEEIGQGFYAIVYHGVWNGSDVAIKVYLQNDYQERLLLDYRKEIAIMKRLRHPNVVLFMGAVYSPERLAIVTEFLPRGSLFRTLHKSNQKLDLKRRLKMALDVARGMNYLHRRKPPIIHRDLKSSNLLVDKNLTVKVGDFGLSCVKISTVMTAASGRGTPQWMAPEVLRGECTSEKSDVFSFGVVLWELMTGSVPWSHLSPFQVIGVVGFMDRRLDLPASMDPRVSAIIRHCWESDTGSRPTFQELVGRMGELLGAVTPPIPRRRSEHKTRGSPPENINS